MAQGQTQRDKQPAKSQTKQGAEGQQQDAEIRADSEGMAKKPKQPAHAAAATEGGQAADISATDTIDLDDEDLEDADDSRLEGEGSYTASKKYNDDLARTLQGGELEQRAQEAKQAIEGPEGDELRRAEAKAKRGSPKTDASRKN